MIRYHKFSNKLKRRMSLKVKNWVVGFAIMLSSIVSIGFADSYFEISKNLDIFASLFRELNIYYVDDTNPGQLIEDGISGMLESLDPYTVFIPESDMEDHRFAITGQYGGIGALIRKRQGKVLIAEPYQDFPAHKAGLIAGDVILEVDGKVIEGKNTTDVSKILKGQPGTVINIKIKRLGEEVPMDFEVTRGEITIKSVPYYGMVNENIGYIKLASFTSKAGEEVKDALLDLKENNQLSGLVFDLRGNPGGLLREAVNIVNLFVKKGEKIVSTKGRLAEWDKQHKSINDPIDIDIPIVCVVNSQSASASEIVSGAIQDLDRGLVVGQRTYGKGLVQQTLKLSYNSQLKVTTAKYYIPSGRCIQALDYSNRNKDGSVGKVPDSLITEFVTNKGRKVYDGGGIMPDIKIEPKRPSNILIGLMNKMLIFDYATRFVSDNPEISLVGDYNFSDSDYDSFKQFLSDKDYDYVTKSEKKLEELQKAAEKEKYFENAKSEFEALQERLSHNKEADLVTFKDEIIKELEKEIISRYYFQKGKYEYAMIHDDAIKEARELLSDTVKYQALLSVPIQQDSITENPE